MTTERRREKRVARPVDARWRGGSGGGMCRVSDLSLVGCFIQTLATTARGEQTVVTLDFGPGDTLDLPGRVAYHEHGSGFAVEFDTLPEADLARLRRWFETGA